MVYCIFILAFLGWWECIEIKNKLLRRPQSWLYTPESHFQASAKPQESGTDSSFRIALLDGARDFFSILMWVAGFHAILSIALWMTLQNLDTLHWLHRLDDSLAAIKKFTTLRTRGAIPSIS